MPEISSHIQEHIKEFDMKPSYRYLVTILLVVALCLTSVTPAFAEEPPPPPPVEDPGGGAPQNDLEQPAAPRVESQPASEPPPPPTAGSDPNYVSMPNYAPNSVATSGMGTFLGEQLVNTSGNPLADGANLAALTAGTAYACPPGQLPAALFPGGTCLTAGVSSVQDAVDDASPGWTVWLSDYYDVVTALTIDKALTIQGNPLAPAYLGILGSTLGFTIASSNVTIKNVVSRGAIQVGAYGGVLRLQDVVVDSAWHYGVFIEGYAGSIILSQVNVSGSLYGSYVDASGGTGTVTVVNSVFDHTQTAWDTIFSGFGIHIIANNTVKLENVSASENVQDGLFVEYAKGLSIKNGFFDYNYEGDHNPASRSYTNVANGLGNGIFAVDTGATPSAVLLQNVFSNNNDENGVHLDIPGAVTVSNSLFGGNALTGLSVDSGRSTATLDGVRAENNGWQGGEGAFLNILGTANINSSSFANNVGSGLVVNTMGAINLKQVKSFGNTEAGAMILNNYTGTSQGVNVTGGYFYSNGMDGILILSRGNVTLNGVTASWNNLLGGAAAIHIDNCQFFNGDCTGVGNVTFTNSMGNNNINNNNALGVHVHTRGNFTATSLHANDNHFSGVVVDGSWGVGNVTITNSSMNQNGQPYYSSPTSASGLTVHTRGSITLDKVETNDNTLSGIFLDNSFATSAKPVTLKNVSTLSNRYNGLEINSRGAVTINHLTSIYNYLNMYAYGLKINNTYSDSTAPVSILNTLGDNTIAKNNYGASIMSGGSISFKGLDVSDNLSYGLYLLNDGGTGPVSITNSTFNHNGSLGLSVNSKGNITLNNVQANENSFFGAYLNNLLIAGKSVTVSKSTFNYNQAYGLSIFAGGTITLNAIQASWNQSDSGVVVDNNTWGAYNVSVLSSLGANQFSHNGVYGLGIATKGNVVVSKAIADYNMFEGLYVNFSGAAGKTITFTCSNASFNLSNLWIQNSGSPVSVYLNGTGLSGGVTPTYGWSGTVNFIVNRTNCP
jgi:hypothetical protein